jgi:hypothetical protein
MKSSSMPREECTGIEFRRLVKQDRHVLKKLRSLEGDEEVSSIVYFEAREAAASLKKRKGTSQPITITKYKRDVFLNEPLTFPMLFSQYTELKMSRSELMTELSVIMDMAQAKLMSGPHIYSILVREPKDIRGFVNLNKLGEYFEGTIPTDLSSGYIYGPFLYELPQFVRSIVLEGVLGNATEIEIGLRNPSTSILERKRVILGQT